MRRRGFGNEKTFLGGCWLLVDRCWKRLKLKELKDGSRGFGGRGWLAADGKLISETLL